MTLYGPLETDARVLRSLEAFKEINKLAHPENAIILFDEIDAIALDRLNNNDLREMGRATSTLLKEFLS